MYTATFGDHFRAKPEIVLCPSLIKMTVDLR